MRSLGLLICIGALVAFGGCVASVNPLATDEVTQITQEFCGTWSSDSGTQLSVVADDEGYQIDVLNAKGPRLTYRASLLSLGAHAFLDLTESRKPSCDPALHQILAINQISPESFSVSAIDPRLLRRVVRTNEPGFPLDDEGLHGTENAVVLTGSTAELQDFFAKYGDQVFRNTQIMYRRTMQGQADVEGRPD